MIGDGFERLFLPHDHADALFFAVSHELGVADSTLFPLLVSPPEQLSPDLHDALEVLFAGGRLHRGQINL